jgi:hypothetical protein
VEYHLIDISAEHLLSLADAAKRLPGGRTGKQRHVSWFIRNRDEIELIRIGGFWYTSVEALQRYADCRCNRVTASSAPLRTAVERHKAIERAEAEAAKLGV